MTYPRVKFQDENEKKILSDFVNQLENVLKNDNDIAAFVTEAGIISGWGSTYLAPKGFLTEIRRITKKCGVLLIIDEVGTGFSRTGKLYAINHENITPDIVVFAKGIGNGAAIAATVTTKEIGEKTFIKANPQSTFGWMPLNVAAALKTLEIHQRDKVWIKAEKDGKYIVKILREKLNNNPLIDDVNGIGMEIGVSLIKDDKVNMRSMIQKARDFGLHLAYADSHSFQIMPPLTIERKNLDKGIEIFIKTIESFI